MEHRESRGLLCHHQSPVPCPPAALMAISFNYLKFLVLHTEQQSMFSARYMAVHPLTPVLYLNLIFQSVCFLWYSLCFFIQHCVSAI